MRSGVRPSASPGAPSCLIPGLGLYEEKQCWRHRRRERTPRKRADARRWTSSVHRITCAARRRKLERPGEGRSHRSEERPRPACLSQHSRAQRCETNSRAARSTKTQSFGRKNLFYRPTRPLYHAASCHASWFLHVVCGSNRSPPFQNAKAAKSKAFLRSSPGQQECDPQQPHTDIPFGHSRGHSSHPRGSACHHTSTRQEHTHATGHGARHTCPLFCAPQPRTNDVRTTTSSAGAAVVTPLLCQPAYSPQDATFLLRWRAQVLSQS